MKRRPPKPWEFHLVLWGNIVLAIGFVATLALFYLGIAFR